MTSQAYVTLVTNDEYAEGAIVLGQSLRESGTNRTLVVMVTSGVTEWTRHRLSKLWDQIRVVDEVCVCLSMCGAHVQWWPSMKSQQLCACDASIARSQL